MTPVAVKMAASVNWHGLWLSAYG